MSPEPFILGGSILAGVFGIGWFLRHRCQKAAVTLASITNGNRDAADCLILGDFESPLITVTPIAEPAIVCTEIPGASHIASKLEPLLSRTPELFNIGRDMTQKTMRVVFSREVTRGLQNGTFTCVEDAAKKLMPVARDVRSGRFVGVGKAVATGGVRLANIAAAGWQIAAIATAQQYLGEINARLKSIEDRVADIGFFQMEEKRAELRAAVRLLRQYHEAISRGELHDGETAAIYQKFEDIEHTCLAIGELARELAKREFDRLDSLSVNEITDPQGTASRAADWVTQSREALELVFLSQSCRVMACHVKAALPGDRALLGQRIQQAKDDLHTAANRLISLRDAFEKKVVHPLNPKGDLLRQALFYGDHRPTAEKAFAAGNQFAVDLALQIDTQACHAQQLSARFDQLADSGLALDVRVSDQGKIEVLSAQPA